jgi:hypothetical protein
VTTGDHAKKSNPNVTNWFATRLVGDEPDRTS